MNQLEQVSVLGLHVSPGFHHFLAVTGLVLGVIFILKVFFKIDVLKTLGKFSGEQKEQNT